MNELSLFSGAGGGLLASRLLGWRTIGYVEWDAYCQAVIKARQADGLLDVAPVFGDIREFVASGAAREYRGLADVVSGGFPCQPFSVAGKRAGTGDERNMWPAFREVVREVRPRHVFAENVPGLLSWDGGSYFGRILGDLAALGFAVRWTVLGADDVGAPHRRKRLWILADSSVRAEKKEGAILPSASRDVADAAGTRHGSRGCVEDRSPWDETRGQEPQRLRCSGWWSLDPADLPDTEDSERDGGRDRTGRGGESASDGGLQPGVGIGGPIESRVGRVAHGSPDGLDKP